MTASIGTCGVSSDDRARHKGYRRMSPLERVRAPEKMMTAWVVRAGVAGERDDWALTRGLAGGGFQEFDDLTALNTREQVAAMAQLAFPNDHPMRVAIFAGQMWALRGRIKPGDIVVLPLKSTKRIALGFCTGGYRYLSEEEPTRRHAIEVAWQRTDLPRVALKDDLLNTINGAMTIFEAAKNNAEARLRALMATGSDAGSGGALKAPNVSPPRTTPAPSADPVDPNPAITPEAIRDSVRTHLIENFGQHKLTRLVADILTAEGYVCDVSPPGPDFGVDIIAGRGPLGLDSPTLIVEVKSEAGSIGVSVLNGLLGSIKTHRADQGLLVAWGGLAKPAENVLRTERLSVRVWDAEALLDRVFAVYERLPAETRARLPLVRAWVLASETG